MLLSTKSNLHKICAANHSLHCVRYNHYKVLGVSKAATQKEIKSAYLKLCKQEHPDQNKDSRSHDRFVKISEAYTVLSKPSTRKDYDQTLGNHFEFPSNSKFRPGFEGRPPPGAYERYPGQFYTDPREDPGAYYHGNPWEHDEFVRNNPNYFHQRGPQRPQTDDRPVDIGEIVKKNRLTLLVIVAFMIIMELVFRQSAKENHLLKDRPENQFERWKRQQERWRIHNKPVFRKRQADIEIEDCEAVPTKAIPVQKRAEG